MSRCVCAFLASISMALAHGLHMYMCAQYTGIVHTLVIVQWRDAY